MDLSSVDPYSYANTGIAKVVHIHLNLFVDFDETVLRGTAILFIEMEPEYDKIILDMYQLNEDKMYVTDYISGHNLEYDVTQNVDSVGSKFVLIRIPPEYRGHFTQHEYKYYETPYQIKFNCIIQIIYETRKGSPVLYWLRSDQTSDGSHPFLITNNEFTYARGIFPCQDSPSIRFTFTAERLKFTNDADNISSTLRHNRMTSRNDEDLLYAILLLGNYFRFSKESFYMLQVHKQGTTLSTMSLAEMNLKSGLFTSYVLVWHCDSKSILTSAQFAELENMFKNLAGETLFMKLLTFSINPC